jgi:subtilisin
LPAMSPHRPSITVAVSLTLLAVAMAPPVGADSVRDRLAVLARRNGTVRVIARLDVPFRPEGILSAAGRALQRNQIEEERSSVLDEVADTGSGPAATFQTVPFVALEASPDGLDELRASPHVTGVVEDLPLAPDLAQSTQLVEATDVRTAGLTGIGQTVAVIDSGIEAAHPFIGGKVVEEACFSASKSCPNGRTSQAGPGAGVPCTFSPDCSHGTHVAGIVAGTGQSFSGVAPGASLLSVRVYSPFTGSSYCGLPGTCARAYTSDVLEGLEHVYALRARYAFAAVNVSIGIGGYRTYCDADPLKPAIDNLRAAGIATVVSSGNDGFADAISSPACVSGAVSVGASTDFGEEAVAPYSNSAWFLSLLAPGSIVSSSVPGGTFDSYVGTSMAAPHVAGAFAVLRQKDPSVSVDDLVEMLQRTGRPVLDPRNGLTKPSIRIYAAAFGHGPGPPASVSLRLRKHLTAVGRVSGGVFPGCDPPITVTVQRFARGWGSLRTVVMRPSGRYRAALPDRPGRYRAVASADSPGEGSCSAMSPARRYRRTPQTGGAATPIFGGLRA